MHIRERSTHSADCGAERVFRRDPYTMSSDGEGFVEAYSSVGRSSGYTEETPNLSMTAKQPPSYNRKVSWLRYEELVDDWVAFTTIEASKRGPLLKSRLTGDAHMYKAVLQKDLLQDPDEGVNYFKNTEEVLPEGVDQRVLIQTSQFLQSQKAEHRVPHIHIHTRNPLEDEEGLEGFMSTNDEETFWALEENDAFIARKVSGRSFRFKKRKGK